MIDSRRTYLDITYNAKNIKAELEEHLKDWTFTDNLSGEIDDLQIVLEDVAHKWLDDWFPVQGSILNGTIFKKHSTKMIKTKIGKFEVDEITAAPSEVTIKALAVPESSSIRGEYKSKSWEKTHLKVVASDIAKRNHLKLYYQANENPKKDRYEQESETDLMFLYRLCNDEGFCLKLSNRTIVILDEADYENNPAIATINRLSKTTDEVQVEDWSAKTTLTGIYKSCRLTYKDSKKKTIKASFTPPLPPKTSRVLVIKEQVKSVAEGLRLCKKRLRWANKEATTVSLTVTSERYLDAGDTVNLKGFGKFNGKYIITQAAHSQNSVQLQLRKCLVGY
jgi:uncharacterized protein